MKPCVSTLRYGGMSLPASDNSSEDWNQPRCWSLPSKYMSHWKGSSFPRSSGRLAMTAREDEPESIQTSSVSADFVTASGPAQPFGLTAAHSSAAERSNQALEPC